jgi:hypothetical protein
VFIDKAAVRGLYKQLMDGWNTGSGEAFAAFHQSLFDKRFKGTRLVGEVKSVRFLTPEVAVMPHCRGNRNARKIRAIP